MSNNASYTKFYDDLPKIAKILLQIFLGGLISPVYRILRYLETKNIVIPRRGGFCGNASNSGLGCVIANYVRGYASAHCGCRPRSLP